MPNKDGSASAEELRKVQRNWIDLLESVAEGEVREIRKNDGTPMAMIVPVDLYLEMKDEAGIGLHETGRSA